jgi:TPR repeat protein
MPTEFQFQKVVLPDHPCQRCPSQEWILNQGVPSICAKCKHPYPKYQFQSKEEEQAYGLANQTLNEKDFDLAFERFQAYVNQYPTNPDGLIGLLLATYKISYEIDQKTGSYIPRNHDIQLPPNLDKEQLFKEALKAFQSLGDDEAFHHWESLASKLNQTIKSYNLFIRDAKPCEVFISFKHTIENPKEPGSYIESEDVAYAEAIYHRLLKEGLTEQQVFFSKVDNKQYTGDFEAKIYYKLQTAKQFILVGSSQDYLDSPWVKNEWSRYLQMMKQGQKHPESFIFVVKNKTQIIPKLDDRLKRFNLFDVNDQDHLEVITEVVKHNQETMLGFTPLMTPVALETLMDQSETIEEEAKFLQSKSTIQYQKSIITDFEKIEVNRLEIEWHNRNLAKAKSIAEKLIQDYPNNATALKYLFMIEAKVENLSELTSTQWMNDKEDLQTLFNYLTALPYTERTSLVKQLMATSIDALSKKLPLVYPLISFFLLTNNLLQDGNLITQYVDQLKTHLKDYPDFSLFEIITNYDKKEVNPSNLPLYLSLLGKINGNIASSVSLKYLIRILKFDPKVLEKPFPYHIFKRVLFFEFNCLVKTDEFVSKTAHIIMQIASYMKTEHVAVEFLHLIIRHTLKLGLFEEASGFILQLQTTGEKPEYVDYYRFFVEQKITSIAMILTGKPILADSTFEMVSNRLLSSDNLNLAKQWLLLQDYYKRVLDYHQSILNHDKPMKEILRLMKVDNHVQWQYKPGLFAKPFEGDMVFNSDAILSNAFFESIKTLKVKSLILGPGSTFMFKGSYLFTQLLTLKVMPGVKFIDGDQTFTFATPMEIIIKAGEDSDTIFLKLRLMDIYQLHKLGDADAMNQYALLSLIGLERFDDFVNLPQVQKQLVVLMLTQNIADTKTWMQTNAKHKVYSSLISKYLLDVPLLATKSLMEVLAGKIAQKPRASTIQLLKDAQQSYSASAMHNLAYFYFFGEGVDKRIELAADLWMKAIERGESSSEYPLYNAVLIHQSLLKDEKIKEFIQLYKEEVFKAKDAMEKAKHESTLIPSNTNKKPTPSKPAEYEYDIKKDIWLLLNHENKAVAKEAFAKVLDQHKQGDQEATLLLANILFQGFKYMKSDVHKAIEILEQTCHQGNTNACQRFMDIVKRSVNSGVLPANDALKQRILSIQKLIDQDS